MKLAKKVMIDRASAAGMPSTDRKTNAVTASMAACEDHLLR